MKNGKTCLFSDFFRISTGKVTKGQSMIHYSNLNLSPAKCCKKEKELLFDHESVKNSNWNYNGIVVS